MSEDQNQAAETKVEVKPVTTGDDPQTDKIVDEIVAKESDDLLAAEDDKLNSSVPKVKTTLRTKLKNFLSAWWNNRIARWATILCIIILLVLAAVLPQSRYFLLNTAGVRSSASLTVLDDSTEEPLKNVQVRLAGHMAMTDIRGNVELTQLRLGQTELVIEKRAFAKITQKQTVGWGSNPLGNFKLKPQGTQYDLSAVDFLSQKPIAGAEASSDEASALANDKGQIKLTIDQPADKIKATVRAEGYRDETIEFSVDAKTVQAIKMVPASKHVFVSQRSGKFDVYSIDVDGKNEKKILAGTGNERDDIIIARDPKSNFVAVVSTRDNQKDKDGFLLSTLTLVDLSNSTTYKVAQSERIQIVDWVGGRLVYIQIAAGASEANPRRYRLMNYDPGQKISKEMASSNYFNDILSAQNKIYYAPSGVYSGGTSVGFYAVNGDGASKQTIKSDEVWNAFRTAYDHIILSIEQEWTDYKIGSGLTKLNGAPANLINRVYIDSPDNKRSLWVDNRDGKGVLLSYDIALAKDKILTSQNSLKYPVRWVSNSTVIYRINSQQETADYVFSLDGGQPRKITNVTNTGGIDKWYYY